MDIATLRPWGQRPLTIWLGDAGLMVAVAVVVDLQIRLATEPGSRHVDALAYFLGILFALPLPFRRRWPLTVLLFCVAVFFLYNAMNYPGFSPVLPWAIPLFALARAGKLWYAVIIATMSLWITLWFSSMKLDPGVPLTLDEVLRDGALLAALILLGETMRSRRALAEETARAARLAQADQEEKWRRRLIEERLQIARELHDVLAHTLTSASLQAGVASDALGRDIDTSRTALRAVRDSYRQARSELAATVGVLRSVDADPLGTVEAQTPERPAAGLAQLETLIATTRLSGLDVRMDVTGETRPLPPAVELTVYRIVQQSLTNVVQHAQASTATVTLKFRREDITVSVVDDGRGEDPDSGRDGRRGFGVLGMHERAAAIGGSASIGPKLGGGYRVTATLPYGYHEADAS